MYKWIVALVVVGAFLIWPSIYFLQTRNINSVANLCRLVYDRVYLRPSEIIDWYGFCLERADEILVEESTPKDQLEFGELEMSSGKSNLLDKIQSVFSYLNVSHLNIYNPEADRQVWQGEARENGIECEYVDGDLFVFRVKRNSPASRAGILRGDIIVSIDGKHPDPDSAQYDSGEFIFQRKLKKFKISMTPAVVKDDQNIELVKLSPRTVLLRVPSFRSEFFEKEKWLAYVEKIKKQEKIIIDLRGNSGGNFVAGLRFLSPFMCSPQEIGYFVRPKLQHGTEYTIQDDLNDEKQFDAFDTSYLTHLKTFSNYGCLASRVAILIDNGTASTAELVAQALHDYLGAPIMGNRSSGQLLVGIWYPVKVINQSVRVSIPEAIYQTRRGRLIEKNGVEPNRTLSYEREDILESRDTWVQETFDSF